MTYSNSQSWRKKETAKTTGDQLSVFQRIKRHHDLRSQGINPATILIIYRLRYRKPYGEPFKLPALKVNPALVRAYFKNKPQPQTQTRKWQIVGTDGTDPAYDKQLTQQDKTALIRQMLESCRYYGTAAYDRNRENALTFAQKQGHYLHDDTLITEWLQAPANPPPPKTQKPASRTKGE